MTLRDAIATPSGKQRYVRRLFGTIADRYDFITAFLSYGQDQRWKRRLIALADLHPSDSVLDLACGTGDIAFGAAAQAHRVIGLDVTFRMLELARRRGAGPPPGSAPRAAPDDDEGLRIRLVHGDMLALPFPDRSFSVVTTGYGIRNVPDLTQSLVEIRRVLGPGGRLLSLDFNRPANIVVRAVYLAYLTVVGSLLGLALHGDPDTYRYIPESIRRYPGAEAVVKMLEDIGFVNVRVVPVLGGLMAIHRAVAPADESRLAQLPPSDALAL